LKFHYLGGAITKYKPIVLIILDGWGLSPSWGGNALVMNNPRNIDRLWRNYPHTILQALGAIEYGNIIGESRLGHMMIGAGRSVQGAHSRINQEIKNRTFYKNKAIKAAFDWAKRNNSNLHLIGMISDGGVHSDVEHLLALLNFGYREGFDRVYIDAITDGTDSPPTEALKFIEKINKKIDEVKIGAFSSVIGRDYAMDRNEHWEKIQKYINCIIDGRAEVYPNIGKAITANYHKGKNDEFIEPALIKQKTGKTVTIKDNDAVIFFNFREDRAKELAKVFLEKGFRIFLWKPKIPNNLYFLTFTKYQDNSTAKIAFPSDYYAENLSEVLSNLNFKQLKVAESEKTSHVTNFFNGGKEENFAGEERKIISSPNVTSYDKKPILSAKEITNTVCKAINSNKYDFILVNYANVDIIAHTGNIIAVGQAVQFLDKFVQEVANTNLKFGGATIITSDHGNAEQMVSINKSYNERETIHTLNPVPFIYVNRNNKKNLIQTSISYQPNALAKIIDATDTLADIAPTILEILGIPKPKQMTGHSLLNRLE